jgi:hypothetical protein
LYGALIVYAPAVRTAAFFVVSFYVIVAKLADLEERLATLHIIRLGNMLAASSGQEEEEIPYLVAAWTRFEVLV